MTGMVYGPTEKSVVCEANYWRKDGWVAVGRVVPCLVPDGVLPNDTYRRRFAVQIAKPKLIDEC